MLLVNESKLVEIRRQTSCRFSSSQRDTLTRHTLGTVRSNANATTTTTNITIVVIIVNGIHNQVTLGESQNDQDTHHKPHLRAVEEHGLHNPRSRLN